MTDASDQAKFKRHARWFRVMSTFAIALALICAGTQVVVAAAPLWKGGDARQALFNVSLELVLAVPSLFYVVGLHRARQVFNRIGAGELLTLNNAKGLTGVGMCVLAGGLWSSLVSDGQAPPPSHDQIAVWLDPTSLVARDLTLAALGLGIVMIGRLLAAAARLQAESDSFL